MSSFSEANTNVTDSKNEQQRLEQSDRSARQTPENGVAVHQLPTVHLGATADIEPTLGWRTWTVYTACCLLCFGINYAVSACGFWLPYVIPHLGGAEISIWFGEGLLVLQVALTPLVGQLADFGSPSRRVLAVVLATLGSMGLFIAGSVNTMHQAIIGVVFTGFSLIVYNIVFAITSEVVPHRMRGLALGSQYAILGMGGLLNNLMGGAIIRANLVNGWRYNLYISAAVQLLGALVLLAFYRPLYLDVEEPSYFERVKARIDWIGNAIWMCAFIAIMFGLISGGSVYPWNSAPPIASLVVGFSLGVALAAHQIWYKKDGIFHHGLFENRNYALSIVGIFIEGVVYITLNIWSPQQTGTLYTSDPVTLGLHFSVLLIMASLVALFAGWYSKRYRRVKELLVGGYIIVAGGIVGFALCRPGKRYDSVSYASFFLVGFGFGPPQALIVAIAQLAVAPDLSGLATAHIIGIRSMGGTIGAAIASAIFTAKINAKLVPTIASYASSAGVSAGDLQRVVDAVAGASGQPVILPGISDAQIAAAQDGRLEAYAQSYQYIFFSIIPWTVVAAIAMSLLRSVRDQMTWVIDKPVETEQALGVRRTGGPEAGEEVVVAH